MEFLIVAIMIVLGLGIAAVVAVVAGAVSAADKNRERANARISPDRDSIAASIVYQIAAAGGADSQRVLRFLREEANLLAPVTPNAHIGSWADAYRRSTTLEQREALLDLAVRAAVAHNAALPLEQYNALLDLSFGLGFQTDALARLRARYRFEYTDYAKHGRPVSADRSGGGAPLFQRPAADAQPLLSVLGLSGKVSRHDLTSAYRRLAAQNHPDRFYGSSTAQQAEAAARFIEITEAYEQLLPLCE
jgi:hypothetical protein